VGEACARDSLSAAIHQACLQAGISPREIARTCAGVTGAARPEIAAVMRGLISGVAGGKIEIATDVEIGFEDAFGSDPGILVIAGTGAIAFGRNLSGVTARAGGLGFPISDEGSGYWIGVEAVRMALHARDRGENPALLNALMAGLGAKDFDDFIVRANATPSPDFATLSPIVLSSAEGGGELAREVLDRAGRELGRIASVVAMRLFGDGACSVATHGGVLSSSEIVRRRFRRELESQVPNAVLLERAIDPARGALERARRAFQRAESHESCTCI
jgi:N-acetylglucosamine kinase-like BadF-type ATPase